MIKKFLKYFILKCKWKNKIRCAFNSNISLKTKFEGMNVIHKNVELRGYIGLGTYICENSRIIGKVGRFCSIAPYVRCNEGFHPYTYPFVTTSPLFYSLNPKSILNGWTFATRQMCEEISYCDTKKNIPIIIGNDCWIGEGVFLSGGITIGDGAVILAHAVVTKNIPPYAIAGGIPAKVIKFRYSKDDIDFLLGLKWWDMPLEWLKNNWELLDNINKLKKYFSDKSDKNGNECI